MPFKLYYENSLMSFPPGSLARRTLCAFDYIHWRPLWMRRICPTNKPHIILKASR